MTKENEKDIFRKTLIEMLLSDGESRDNAVKYADEIVMLISDSPWKGFSFLAQCVLDIERKVDYLIQNISKSNKDFS